MAVRCSSPPDKFATCDEREYPKEQSQNYRKTDLLVHDFVHQHRTHDVRHELWVHVSVADLGVQQLPHRALKLRRNLLRLVANRSI